MAKGKTMGGLLSNLLRSSLMCMEQLGNRLQRGLNGTLRRIEARVSQVYAHALLVAYLAIATV